MIHVEGDKIYAEGRLPTYPPIVEGVSVKSFIVIYETTVREQYQVFAESEGDAWDKWAQGNLFSSEAIEGGVVGVYRDE